MISVEKLKVEFGIKPLFQDASFVINDNDKVALVGKNGAGKSTLLKILCGQQQPTDGKISISSDMRIGYLPQVMILQDDTTVREEARKSFSDIINMKDKIDAMSKELTERTDYDSDEYIALVDKYTQEHDRYLMLGGENYEAEIERILTGLGFYKTDFDRPTSEFSGGWRMRIELAKILLSRPDCLLLDEPTNHLDIESIQWLERFLQQSSKAVILVSHDKAFINNVTISSIIYHTPLKCRYYFLVSLNSKIDGFSFNFSLNILKLFTISVKLVCKVGSFITEPIAPFPLSISFIT